MKQPVIWRVIVLALTATAILSACSGKASPTEKGIGGTMWVADEEGNSITVINAATNKVIATLNGVEGHTTCKSHLTEK